MITASTTPHIVEMSVYKRKTTKYFVKYITQLFYQNSRNIPNKVAHPDRVTYVDNSTESLYQSHACP